MAALSVPEVRNIIRMIQNIEYWERQLGVQPDGRLSRAVEVKYNYSIELNTDDFFTKEEMATFNTLKVALVEGVENIVKTKIAKLKKELLDEYGIVWEEK